MQDDELSEDQSFSMLCTQEVDEDIDVIWDWNSPRANRASHLHLKKQKRLYPSQSPKLTIKRHASNSNIPKFDKLKEEFEAFRNELNSSLRLDNNNENKCFNDFDDDSVEEQLILCSQRIENEFENKTKFCNNVELHNNPTSDSTRSSFSNLLHGTLQEASNSDNSVKKIADDSFDLAIIELPFDDFEVNSPIKEPEESNKTVENQSLLESNEVSNSNEYVKKHPSFELSQSCSKAETSPIKCSPEEIEQKRRQALAKLEAKKQSVIEKNRQEALKRLQLSRQRRALEGQNTLPRRTHSLLR